MVHRGGLYFTIVSPTATSSCDGDENRAMVQRELLSPRNEKSPTTVMSTEAVDMLQLEARWRAEGNNLRCSL